MHTHTHMYTNTYTHTHAYTHEYMCIHTNRLKVDITKTTMLQPLSNADTFDGTHTGM